MAWLVAALATAAGAGAQAVARDTAAATTAADSLAAGDSSGFDAPLFLPAVLYGPETRWGGGIGVLSVSRERDPQQRPDAFGAEVLLTQNRQYTIGANTDFWTAGNTWRIETSVSAVRYPNRFFGTGISTPTTFEKYNPTSLTGIVAAQRAVRPGLYVGGRVAYDRTRVDDLEPGGLIDGRPDADGWRQLVVSSQLVYDTRDRVFAARRGAVASLVVARADRALGSEFVHTRITGDVRRYWPIHERGVFAWQARSDVVLGEVPFDRLPSLGGPTLLRGFFAGRFRERALGITQAEYRVGPWLDLVGLTVFGGIGSVASTFGELGASAWRAAGGVGLRLVAEPRTGLALRLDYGVGRGSRGFYVTVGEAF
jgi:outer membrane protein assembly factor BamA